MTPKSKELNREMLSALRDDQSVDEYMANFAGAEVLETKAMIIISEDGTHDCLIVDEFGDLIRAEEIVRENNNRIWGIENIGALLRGFD
jgi:hypothetical protein